MTTLWFFLVVSLNGEVTAFHGFQSSDDCMNKRAAYMTGMKKVVRDITECVGIPVKGPAMK